MSDLDLFGWSMGRPSKYPDTPGYRRTDTSRAAADAIVGRSATLRERALARIDHGAATADEVALLLGESVLAIRPRVTELARMGLIVDTGARRKNASGRAAIVWMVSR